MMSYQLALVSTILSDKICSLFTIPIVFIKVRVSFITFVVINAC